MKKSLKKILVSVAVLLVGASAFAEFNISAYSTILPFNNLVTDEQSVLASGNGFGITLQPIFDSGFTFRVNLAYQTFRGDNLFVVSEDNKLGGNGAQLNVGFGGTLVQNERLFCTLTGVLGLFIQGINYEDSSVEDENTKTEITELMINFRTGLDLTTTLRLNRVIGLYTNLGLYYDIGSVHNNTEITTKISRYGYSYSDSEDVDSSSTISGFTFAPSIGLTLTLGSD